MDWNKSSNRESSMTAALAVASCALVFGGMSAFFTPAQPAASASPLAHAAPAQTSSVAQGAPRLAAR